MRERRGTTRLVAIGAMALAACGGAGEAPAATGAATADAQAAPEPEAARAVDKAMALAAIETRTFKFNVTRPEDQRRLVLEVDVPVPRTWADRQANPNPVQATLLPPSREEAGARMTIAATCFGTCTAARAEANLNGAAALQAAPLAGARVVRDEALTPPRGVDGVPGARMRGWAITMADGGRALGVGLQPEAETGFIVACQAELHGAYASHAADVYDLCAHMKVRVIDPALPIDQLRLEREALAKCPPAAQVTYTVKAPAAGEPTAFGAVQSVLAVAPRPGQVALTLGDATLSLRLGFDAGTLGGEVLSGILPARHGPVRIEAALTTPNASIPFVGDALEGQVELVARTRTALCGKFTLADGNRRIEGEFPATPLRIGIAP